jgi:hypothetical protein
MKESDDVGLQALELTFGPVNLAEWKMDKQCKGMRKGMTMKS